MRPWMTAAVVSASVAVVTGLSLRHVPPAAAIGETTDEAPSSKLQAPGSQPGARSQESGPGPRVVLYYTGEQRGYLEPCGCSKPMIGGIARRARYLAQLPKEVAAIKVDNGDLVEEPVRQQELKAEALAQFYAKAGYHAVNLGEKDYRLGFGYLRYLQSLANVPFLSANVTRGEGGKPAFGTHTIVTAGSLPVAILGVLAPEPDSGKTVTQWNPDLTVVDPGPVLDRLQKEIEGKAKFVVLLYHGEPEGARELARSRPWIDVIVTAHEAEEYRARPIVENGVTILNAGQKGKHLGQLEIRQGTDGEARAEALLPVAMEEAIGDDPATREILRQYLSHVASENLLAKVAKQKSPNGQAFAGTAKCVSCHAKAHNVWKTSAHAKAFKTLVDAGHQADPDCVGCHVVGLEYQGGFRTIQQTPHLKDVGCESCHKPQAAHAKNPKIRPKKVGAASCANCHVPDHSPTFDFKTYWAKIRH